MNIEKGYYHIKHPSEPEPTLVYFYTNPDTNEDGFGFNISDGGGFLPLSDLTQETEVVKLKITEVL